MWSERVLPKKFYEGGPRVPYCCVHTLIHTYTRAHRCAKDKRRLLKNRAQQPNPGLISSHQRPRHRYMTAQRILYIIRNDYCTLHNVIIRSQRYINVIYMSFTRRFVYHLILLHPHSRRTAHPQIYHADSTPFKNFVL